MKEFKAVYDEELMLANPAMNFNHKLYFHLSKGIVYYAKKEFDMAYIMVKELDKHWNKYPWMIETKFGAYYNTYYNKALIELNFKQFSQAIHSIEDLQKKLMELKRENPFQRFMLFNLMIDVYRKCGYFEEALNKIEEYKIARETLHKPEENINSKQLYHFYLANIHFGVGDFKSANRHINEIINNAMDYNKDVTCVAHLMSLIIHYELGKTDLLIYRIKSVYRTLKKKECLLTIIDIVLDFLKDIAKNKFDPGNLKEKLIRLKEEIEMQFAKEPMEKEVMEYFDILSWITSKIEKKTFAQVIKARSGYALG
jgi:tetratricopeptide (TPR) repeat protein